VELGADKFQLNPGATLDLFVENVVLSVGALKFGDKVSPESFRLYMGGEGSIQVGIAETKFHGMIYAPRTHVAFVGVSEVDGALFARDFGWAGTLSVVYEGGAGASAGNCTPASSPIR